VIVVDNFNLDLASANPGPVENLPSYVSEDPTTLEVLYHCPYCSQTLRKDKMDLLMSDRPLAQDFVEHRDRCVLMHRAAYEALVEGGKKVCVVTGLVTPC